MPFFTAKAPVRNGNVNAFRFRAAAGDWERTGRPALCWLNRFGFPRDAVVHPYLTPRLAVNGSNASGRRKVDGNWAQLVGSFGAIVCGRCGMVFVQFKMNRGILFSLRLAEKTTMVTNITGIFSHRKSHAAHTELWTFLKNHNDGLLFYFQHGVSSCLHLCWKR